MDDPAMPRPDPSVSDSRAPDSRLRSTLNGMEIKRKDRVQVATLRPDLVDRMREDHPDLDAEGVVSWQEVTRYRTMVVEELLHAEKGDSTVLEREVSDSMAPHETVVADNVEQEMEGHRSFGERAADHVAEFGGSWNFIILFGVVRGASTGVNTVVA